MQHTRVLFIGFVAFSLITAPAWAKGRTVRIELTCQGLSRPVELTDQTALNFRYGPWGGEFLGAVTQAAPPDGLRLCEVAFYAESERHQVRLAYVAYYAYDPRDRKAPGYVYLPGQLEPWHAMNIGTILRQDRDGRWQQASRDWAISLVRPAIDKAERADHG